MTSISASSSLSSVYHSEPPVSSDEEEFFLPRSTTPANPSFLNQDIYDDVVEELPASIKKPKEKNIFKTAWKIILPAWLAIPTALIIINELTWKDRFIEVITPVSFALGMRVYSQYVTPKKVATIVNPFFASIVPEALFAATNIELNIDNSSIKTAIRTLTFAAAGYFFTHNTLLTDKQREENLILENDTPRSYRFLCLGKNANKYLLTIYYSALIAIGSTFVALGVKYFDDSKVKHLDLDGGTLLLSYALGDLLSTIAFKLYDKCIRPENRRYVEEIMRHAEGPKGFTTKERIIITTKRFFGAMASAVPGILLPLSKYTPHIPLAFAALGAFGGAKRVYDARVYERYDPKVLELVNFEEEDDKVACCKISARKVQHVITGFLLAGILAFAIGCAFNNDLLSRWPMMALFLGDVSGYTYSRVLDYFARKKNNRSINQFDFDSHASGILFLYPYLLMHTKFGLLDTDFKKNSGLIYGLMMFLYVLLGLNFGVNRGRVVSIHNTSPESTSALGLAQLSNNAMQYALR